MCDCVLALLTLYFWYLLFGSIRSALYLLALLLCSFIHFPVTHRCLPNFSLVSFPSVISSSFVLYDLSSALPSFSHTHPLPLHLFTGLKRGVCSQINHFPDDADYDQDAAEYLLRKSHTQAFVKDRQTHTTGVCWRVHANTHSACTTRGALIHTLQFLSHTQKRTEGEGGRTSMHGCQFQAKHSWICVQVSVQRVYVCLNAQVQGVGSLGVFRELFFHRWIERTAFTNGLFSARDSGFTSCLHCDSEFSLYSSEPFSLQGYVPSVHYIKKISISAMLQYL